MSSVHRYAEPFFVEGNKEYICLLIHGFTGSPSEMKPLAKYLANKGYGVSIPLLSGHGITPEEMSLTCWDDWYGSVESEYLRILNKYPQSKIIPIGLSMGGTLVLHLAYNYCFLGIVTMCPGLYLHSKKAYLAPVIQYFKKFELKNATGNIKATGDNEVDNQFFYDKTPIRSVSSQLSMIRKVRKEIPLIKVPSLIIQSKKDRTVDPKGARKIHDAIGSQVRDLIWLEKSGHIITLGPERNFVFKEINHFLNKILQ